MGSDSGNDPGNDLSSHSNNGESGKTIGRNGGLLPADPTKRDNLIVLLRTKSLDAANWTLILCVIGSFVSSQTGHEWAMPGFVSTILSTVYGGWLIGGILPVKEARQWLEGLFKRGQK